MKVFKVNSLLKRNFSYSFHLNYRDFFLPNFFNSPESFGNNLHLLLKVVDMPNLKDFAYLIYTGLTGTITVHAIMIPSLHVGTLWTLRMNFKVLIFT